MLLSVFISMAQAAAAAFHRPAEWDRQSSVIMAWPGQNDFFAKNPEALQPATEDISTIAEAVATFEPVTLLVGTDRLQEAEERFKEKNQIKLLPIQGYKLDLWMRDMAPTFVVNNDNKTARLCGIDYNFNGWGNKVPVNPGASLASIILDNMKTPRVNSSLVTEGGSLEVDGEGTLLVTNSSIVNNNRNPGKSRQDVEDELRRSLGIEKFIWIPGREGLEITDSHIDGLARFVSPGKVLLSKPNKIEDNDVWTDIYNEAKSILFNATDAMGRRLEITEIVEADMYSIGLDKQTLTDIEAGDKDSPALSYVNYLLVNDGVIFPQFGDKSADAAALEVIRNLYKDRKIEPVLNQKLPMLGGGIHCSTQEVPVPHN